LSAALRLWLEGTAFDAKAASLPAPAAMNGVRRYPRAAMTALRADCAVEIDANTGAQEQVKTTIEGLAKRNFDRFVRVENVLPRFDAVHTTMGRLQACVAGSFERKRQAALRHYCQQKCDLDAIDATLTQRAQQLVKSWTP
jgi:hypothetical protein